MSAFDDAIAITTKGWTRAGLSPLLSEDIADNFVLNFKEAA